MLLTDLDNPLILGILLLLGATATFFALDVGSLSIFSDNDIYFERSDCSYTETGTHTWEVTCSMDVTRAAYDKSVALLIPSSNSNPHISTASLRTTDHWWVQSYKNWLTARHDYTEAALTMECGDTAHTYHIDICTDNETVAEQYQAQFGGTLRDCTSTSKCSGSRWMVTGDLPTSFFDDLESQSRCRALLEYEDSDDNTETHEATQFTFSRSGNVYPNCRTDGYSSGTLQGVKVTYEFDGTFSDGGSPAPPADGPTEEGPVGFVEQTVITLSNLYTDFVAWLDTLG